MNFHSSFADGGKEKVSLRSAFLRARKVEITYSRQLRKVARHIGDLIRVFNPNSAEDMNRAADALERYAQTLDPWANAVAQRMLAEVAVRDRQSWKAVSAEMGRALHREIETAPTGAAMQRIMAEQVELIKSLPLEAAQRVHKLTMEGIRNGARAAEIADEIMRSGEVSKSRANTIARTEVGRTSTALTQARAEYIGSPGYVWRSARDSDVRPSHKKMEGQFVAWGSPPTLDGLTGHAGTLPNCRCGCEVIVPE